MLHCIDKDPESIAGENGNVNYGALFSHVEATCNILCPPYDTKRELTCAVCMYTK